MKNILITGADGQLGMALKQRAIEHGKYDYTFLDIRELDLTDEPGVWKFFRNASFDYIINCAAYTAVDMAEKHEKQAYAVNAGVPSLLGRICQEQTAFLLHLSTDYVYSGVFAEPHLEGENPVPLSVYAKSKLKGEQSLMNNPRAIIIRTSWLFSEFGNNFLRNMLRLSKERNELGVVYDQVGNPTYAGDLANALLKIIGYSVQHSFLHGIYNFSNEGICSWYDFAVEIMQLAGRKCEVRPIRTTEYPLPAKRPSYSAMDKTKIKNTFGIDIRHWKSGLTAAIKNLERNSEI